MVQQTLSSAEDTLKEAVKTALPALQTFKGLEAIDALACKTLDQLKESYPSMKDSPDKVRFVNNNKQLSCTQVKLIVYF